MKLVKIQDKHMIRREDLPKWKQSLYDGRGYHFYIMYGEKTKSGATNYKMLATSHYYDPDKVTKIKKKNAILMKIRELKEPTTVINVRYARDRSGRTFSAKYPNMQVVANLSPYQERRIKKELLKRKK